MSEDRRYGEGEVRQILDLALREDDLPPHLPSADGLTLRELQDIGLEIGIPEERVSQAATAFEGRGEALARATVLGVPSSVGWVAPLPRAPSDREWGIMVTDLRATFGGAGEARSHGGIREWSDGMTHAFVEPTEDGYRLRITDTNSAVGFGLAVGGFMLVFALLLVVILLGREEVGTRFAVPVFFSLIGGGLVGGMAMQLPRWAGERERRMKLIAGRITSLLSSPPEEEPPST